MGPGPSPMVAPAAVSSPVAQSNGQTDYSQQWAEYYRSIGKVKEAEAVEAQLKMKQATGAPASGPSPAPGMMPAQPQQPGQFGQYGGYQVPTLKYQLALLSTTVRKYLIYL